MRLRSFCLSIAQLVLLTLGVQVDATSFTIPSSGRATLTHYDLPYNYVASCGCVGASTRYPTAAINARSYGSNNSYGPSCGVCYLLRLESTPLSPPPPEGNGVDYTTGDPALSVIVKITDDCPLGGDWCSQTPDKPLNSQGSLLHFDLAFPSRAISDTFFPTYQGRDYGVWWVTYDVVDCIKWAGYNDKDAWGSDWVQQSSACCPLRPTLPSSSTSVSLDGVQLVTGTTDTDTYNAESNKEYCPSYSDQLAQGLEADEMYKQVPNTSNIRSKRDDEDASNSAWTLFQSGFFWSWSSFRRFNSVTLPPTPLEDWEAIGKPPLLRQDQV